MSTLHSHPTYYSTYAHLQDMTRSLIAVSFFLDALKLSFKLMGLAIANNVPFTYYCAPQSHPTEISSALSSAPLVDKSWLCDQQPLH
jgi:hypothetical protein